MKNKRYAALIAFFLLMLLLFNKPILNASSGMLLGLPSPMLYLGGLWVIIIFSMILTSRKPKGGS